jgi:hypothetical protein
MAQVFTNVKAAQRLGEPNKFGLPTAATAVIDPADPNRVYSVEATVTLAQLNAGHTIVSAVEGRTLKPVSTLVVCSGSFTTLNDIRISDTNSSPVDVITIAQANATNGARFGDVTATGLTFGAGHGANLTAGKGIQVRKTGSNGAGGTSLFVRVMYKVDA